MNNENVIPHKHEVTFEDRIAKQGYAPQLIWFTGLSGSGKSTLASALEKRLFDLGYKTYILDGDNVRKGLNNDLDFSLESRIENIRRIGEVSNLFVNAGVIVLSAFISPLTRDRKLARDLVGDTYFTEIFVDCPLEVCEQRDVKGLYAKARRGEIKDFTGISSPFEAPENAEIIIKTNEVSIDDGVETILEYLLKKIKKG